MKRFTAILLCLIMIAAQITSCNKAGSGAGTETETGIEDIFEIDITKYTLIRPEFLSQTLLGAVVQMKKDIDSKFGISIGIKDDWVKRGTEPDDMAYEILIGATNRRQTGEVLSQMEGPAAELP